MPDVASEIRRLMERAPQMPGTKQLSAAREAVHKAVRAMETELMLPDSEVTEITAKVMKLISSEVVNRRKL